MFLTQLVLLISLSNAINPLMTKMVGHQTVKRVFDPFSYVYNDQEFDGKLPFDEDYSNLYDGLFETKSTGYESPTATGTEPNAFKKSLEANSANSSAFNAKLQKILA